MTSGIIKDIPLLIQSTASSSERRITPTWTITQLKQKLEPITGIPPSAQTLILRLPDQDQEHRIQAEDEDAVQIGKWPLVAYAEIRVQSSLPPPVPLPSASSSDPPAPNPLAPSAYAAKSGTVLDYKRSHQIGRFDPSLPARNAEKARLSWEEVKERGLEVGKRCALAAEDGGNKPSGNRRGVGPSGLSGSRSKSGSGGESENGLSRRGTIKFIGPIPELPGAESSAWIGIELDEPTGRGDGSVSVPSSQQTEARQEDSRDIERRPDEGAVGREGGEGGKGAEGREKGMKYYFHCRDKHAVFVRPERVVVGNFPVLNLDDEIDALNDDGSEDEMEEL